MRRARIITHLVENGLLPLACAQVHCGQVTDANKATASSPAPTRLATESLNRDSKAFLRLTGYSTAASKTLFCGGIDVSIGFYHASPMTSLLPTGSGMFSARVGRCRPRGDEKRFLAIFYDIASSDRFW